MPEQLGDGAVSHRDAKRAHVWARRAVARAGGAAGNGQCDVRFKPNGDDGDVMIRRSGGDLGGRRLRGALVASGCGTDTKAANDYVDAVNKAQTGFPAKFDRLSSQITSTSTAATTNCVTTVAGTSRTKASSCALRTAMSRGLRGVRRDKASLMLALRPPYCPVPLCSPVATLVTPTHTPFPGLVTAPKRATAKNM